MKNINKNKNRNVIEKYLEIYFAKLKIGLKEIKEYPANNIAGFTANFFVSISYILFYFIFSESISGDFLMWNKIDFVLMLMFLMMFSLFLRFFSLSNFHLELLRGNLNNYLFRPINPYSIMSTRNLRGSIILNSITYLIIVIGILSFVDYSNYLFAIFIGILGFIAHVLIINNIFSLSFFLKQGGFIHNVYYKNYFLTIETYTPKMFENSFFKNIVYLTPVSFIGYFIIEVLKGRLELVLVYIIPFILIIFIALILLIIQWHYGLKKYEAFG